MADLRNEWTAGRLIQAARDKTLLADHDRQRYLTWHNEDEEKNVGN